MFLNYHKLKTPAFRKRTRFLPVLWTVDDRIGCISCDCRRRRIFSICIVVSKTRSILIFKVCLFKTTSILSCGNLNIRIKSQYTNSTYMSSNVTWDRLVTYLFDDVIAFAVAVAETSALYSKAEPVSEPRL